MNTAQMHHTPETMPPVASRPLRVLLATDGSPSAGHAADFVRELPLAAGTEIRVLTVIPGVDWDVPSWLGEVEHDWAARLGEREVTHLSRPGIETKACVRMGATAHEIVAAGKEWKADLIALGTQGFTGLESYFVGSAARAVTRQAAGPVLVARAPRHQLFHVVLAVDGSEHAQQAAQYLTTFPLPPATAITVVSVVRPSRFVPALDREQPRMLSAAQEAGARRHATAGRQVAAARRALEESGHCAHATVREGDPAAEILKLAGELGADLIVAGARGASGVKGLVFGSVADRLLDYAPCSLLFVR